MELANEILSSCLLRKILLMSPVPHGLRFAGPVFAQSQPVAGSPAADATREIAKGRVFLFGGAVLLFAILSVILEESDKPLHLLDDVVVVVAAAAIIGLVILWRHRVSAEEVHRQNNLFTVLLLVALAFVLAALPIEASDPVDFGNEPPSIIAIAIFLLNRFVW